MICKACRTDDVPKHKKKRMHRMCANNVVPKSCDCQHRTDRKNVE